LSAHVKKKEKRQHAVWVKDCLRKRETFGCYNSLLMSDLVNHKAIWSNYMRIDIEMFEELFRLVEARFKKRRYHERYHILLFIISDRKLN